MADFIFIAPEGWVTFHESAVDAIPQGIGAVHTWIETQNWNDLTAGMQDGGLIGPDVRVVEAQIFNGEVLVVRYS